MKKQDFGPWGRLVLSLTKTDDHGLEYVRVYYSSTEKEATQNGAELCILPTVLKERT